MCVAIYLCLLLCNCFLQLDAVSSILYLILDRPPWQHVYHGEVSLCNWRLFLVSCCATVQYTGVYLVWLVVGLCMLHHGCVFVCVYGLWVQHLVHLCGGPLLSTIFLITVSVVKVFPAECRIYIHPFLLSHSIHLRYCLSCTL